MELCAIQLRLKWTERRREMHVGRQKISFSIFYVGCDVLSIFWMNVKIFVGILWNYERLIRLWRLFKYLLQNVLMLQVENFVYTVKKFTFWIMTWIVVGSCHFFLHESRKLMSNFAVLREKFKKYFLKWEWIW